MDEAAALSTWLRSRGRWLGSSSTAYAASKGGIVAMTKSLAVKHGDRRIRANAICPGSMDTEMATHLKSDPVQFARFIGQLPLGRQGEAADIEGLVVFLASDSSSYFSGNIVTLDRALTSV